MTDLHFRHHIRRFIHVVRTCRLLARIHPGSAIIDPAVVDRQIEAIRFGWKYRCCGDWQAWGESAKDQARRREEILNLKAALLPTKVEVETGPGTGIFVPFVGSKP